MSGTYKVYLVNIAIVKRGNNELRPKIWLVSALSPDEALGKVLTKREAHWAAMSVQTVELDDLDSIAQTISPGNIAKVKN